MSIATGLNQQQESLWWDCSRPGTAARPSLRSGPTHSRRPKSLRDFVERVLKEVAERVGFEPTDGTPAIKNLLENSGLLVPSNPLASPFVPVDSASSSVVSQIKFYQEESKATACAVAQSCTIYFRALVVFSGSCLQSSTRNTMHVSPST
jgi:hypothetical protein